MNTTNAKEIKKFISEFNELVKTLEDKYNVNISLGNITYSDRDLTTKMTVTSLDEDSEKASFERYAESFGFEKSDYKARVAEAGGVYEFVGFDLKQRKNICLVKNVATKDYAKCSVEAMKRLLKKSKK